MGLNEWKSDLDFSSVKIVLYFLWSLITDGIGQGGYFEFEFISSCGC